MDGLSVRRFCELIPHHGEAEIKNALSFLTEEGHLFTTIGMHIGFFAGNIFR